MARASSFSHPPAASTTPSPMSPRAKPTTSRRIRSIPTYAVAIAGVLAIASFVSPVVALSPFEPPGNQILFGAWLDTAVGYGDTPAKFNSRIGYNTPVFQIAQDLPLPKYNYTTGAGGAAPESLIELSATDAAVFLTVYPVAGFQTATQAEFIALGQQIADYQINLNRTVFLRYAPEMQGTWNLYGKQPTAFIASWILMHSTITAIAPLTIFVWAPNTVQGYPFGETFAARTGFTATTAADILLLDTNKNGQLDAGDNGLDPYYPGDAYVDWIGISLYYKGPSTSDIINVVQPAGYCGLAINGTDPDSMAPMPANWYQTYCAQKPTKACMFSESGAAFHVNDVGASHLALQQGWISDCMTNTALYDAFPRLKLVMQFEFEKVETSNANTQDLRDYRIANDTAILAEFLSDLNPIATRFSWANVRVPPTSISTPGAPAAETNSAGLTVSQAITATTRARSTGFPSLFGVTSDGTQRAEIIEVGVMVVSGVIGALAVMKYL